MTKLPEAKEPEVGKPPTSGSEDQTAYTPGPLAHWTTEDVARLDAAYDLLVRLGLRRRARLGKAALQGEEQISGAAFVEHT